VKIIPLSIPDVLLLEPTVFSDERGFFFESFNQKIFEDHIGKSINFVQDNQSYSQKGVLRGLHYQISPRAQGKLVRVSVGEVFDVVVDIRPKSPTFGQWVGEYLSANNKKQLWIPEGFAHGFLTLSETSQFLYKATNYYSPTHERCLLWDDPTIGIDWPIESTPILSNKDKEGEFFNCEN
jgi:dTDP-4-dehydrorhamnose 3,5-epimerase